MAEIMSPEDVWKGLDDSLPLESDILSTDERDGVSFQRISFLGRETGGGRVEIFALFCYDSLNPSSDVVVLMQDSRAPIDEELCAFFVKRGYTVLCPDYRGVDDVADFTIYPECASYAVAGARENLFACEEGANKTCWYEWVAVGLYARRYALDRTDKESVCVVGVRDGGEIAWKMAALRDFGCAATLAAAGWLGATEEGRAFAAGMDSQSYAPLARCPVFLGCTTNDPLFDCDRAFDTFSRINPTFFGDSSICYSLHSDGLLDEDSIRDLFIFLSKYQKGRYAFVPAPAAVEISADEEQNLKARVSYDVTAIRESVRLFFAEDELLSSRRHWMCCDGAGQGDEYLLNVCRDAKRVFVLARVIYANGYAAWSKISTRKVSGTFKNTENRNAVLYSGDMDPAGFFAESERAVGGIFSAGGEIGAERREGVRGLFSEKGFKTARVSLPRFLPDKEASIKMDVFCDRDAVVTISFQDLRGRDFSREERAIGGVWQSFVEDARAFRGEDGEIDFRALALLTVSCDAPFVCNNIMWL